MLIAGQMHAVGNTEGTLAAHFGGPCGDTIPSLTDTASNTTPPRPRTSFPLSLSVERIPALICLTPSLHVWPAVNLHVTHPITCNKRYN